MQPTKSMADWAQEYANAGLSVIPLFNGEKMPSKAWKASMDRHVVYDFTDATGICFCGGGVSGNGLYVETIDFDLKNDLTGTLMSRWKDAVIAIDPKVLTKLLTEQTPSGGYHLSYKTKVWAKQENLASREATDEEKERKIKSRVMIETLTGKRPCTIYPTPGYVLKRGEYTAIPEITPDERAVLIECARAMNEYIPEPTPFYEDQTSLNLYRVSPFQAYNESDHFLTVLEEEGWMRLSRGNPRIVDYVAPGTKTKQRNASYISDKNCFYAFTDSGQLPQNKTVRPTEVFLAYRTNGDKKEAYRKLLEMGFGEPMPKKPTNGHKLDPMPEKRVAKVDPSAPGDLPFLASRADYLPYLESIRNGTLQLGLSTHTDLDQYWRWKRGLFVPINGHDNVGKTVAFAYLMLLCSMYHGWKFGVMANENSNGGIMRKLIEFYWGIPFPRLTDEQHEEALKFVEKHFFIFKSDGYSHYDVMECGTALKTAKNIDGILIDPYNSLDVEESRLSKINTHEYHYKVLGEWRRWAKANDCSLYVCCHAVTSATRLKSKDGRPVPPGKADTEQGSKFAARADDFITIHRDVGDSETYRQTQINIRKVKEVETGGRPSPITDPFQMVMQDQCKFIYGNNRDAVREWHEKRKSPLERSVMSQRTAVDFDNARELPKEKEFEYSLSPDLNDPGF